MSFTDLYNLKDILNLGSVKIDNVVFRLHYTFTVSLLACFVVIITMGQYMGNHIGCLSDAVSQDVINSYCWIAGTFTIPSKYGTVKNNGIHNMNEKEGMIIYHKYYQWVWLLLSLQALMFYFPHYLWKYFEQGHMEVLSADLEVASIDKNTFERRCKILIRYFTDKKYCHTKYFWQYFICECLNLVNVGVQLLLMQAIFLKSLKDTSIWNVFSFTFDSYRNQSDSLSLIFPKVTKCTFQKYGSSGSIQTYDSLCILSSNVINEKMFIILWYWFVTLGVISLLAVIYRFLSLSLRMRYIVLKLRFPQVHSKQIDEICKHFSIGDWYIFYRMSYNIDYIISEFVIDTIPKIWQNRGSLEMDPMNSN